MLLVCINTARGGVATHGGRRAVRDVARLPAVLRRRNNLVPKHLHPAATHLRAVPNVCEGPNTVHRSCCCIIREKASGGENIGKKNTGTKKEPFDSVLPT